VYEPRKQGSHPEVELGGEGENALTSTSFGPVPCLYLLKQQPPFAEPAPDLSEWITEEWLSNLDSRCNFGLGLGSQAKGRKLVQLERRMASFYFRCPALRATSATRIRE